MKILIIFLAITCVYAHPPVYYKNNNIHKYRTQAELNAIARLKEANILPSVLNRLAFGLYKRCSNLGNDDCSNGYLPDVGNDDDYLGSGNTPGKRCSNLGSDDCTNGYLPEVGNDDDYLGSGNTPGKRCSNLGSDDCTNGYLPDVGNDDDYLGSGNTPGKRCSNLGSDDCANGYLPDVGNDDDYLGSGNTPGKRNIRYKIKNFKNLN